MFTTLAKVVVEFLGRLFHWDMPSTDHTITELPIVPTPPVEAPKQPVAVSKVTLCAKAQQEFEGYFPGSSAYRNKNPGNIKGLDGKFLVFPSYEAGFAALEDYIRRVATGHHKAYPKGASTTIMGYTHLYTGDAEPSPTNYAIHIAKAVGLSTDAPMSALLS